MSRQRGRRRLMAEMNVVPYIDVMLVLLVIFMVTAPLLTQGVNVQLPQVPSEVMPPSENEPVIVSVDVEGRFFIEFGEDQDQPVAPNVLVNRMAALLEYQPEIQVLVRGDEGVPYGRVVTLMALLQGAGVDGVGLMTEPPAERR